jgi:CheY-like chemotaxis protein
VSADLRESIIQDTRSRLVVVEDHAILREGLRALLELEPDLAIAGEASNGIDAVPVVESLKPAMLITDIALPRRSGIELIGCLRQMRLDLKILVLTAHSSEEYIRAALNARAATPSAEGMRAERRKHLSRPPYSAVRPTCALRSPRRWSRDICGLRPASRKWSPSNTSPAASGKC